VVCIDFCFDEFILFLLIDSNDVNRNLVLPSEATFDNEDRSNSDSESDEENDYVRRSTFLRFGRQIPSSSRSFLRFGRSDPSFLRFGHNGNNGAAFLRFGRRAQQATSNNFLRFGRKGEFLRFG
jgi:hypothetical protein